MLAVVDVAVEDHAPDPVGEQLGILLADLRAVGQSEVVEPRFAEPGADRVDVACDRGGVEVVEDRSGQAAAALAEFAVVAAQRVEFGGAGRFDRVGLGEYRGVAGDGVAGADPAGVVSRRCRICGVRRGKRVGVRR
jgi:hypothetical protein